MDIIKEVARLREEFRRELAAVADRQALEQLQVKYLGRKAGLLTGILRGLKDLSAEARRSAGQAANRLKAECAGALAEVEERLAADAEAGGTVDYTLPGPRISVGSRHPITLVSREIITFFERLGFQYREGPEMETEHYNFNALNIPADHPARDEHDTFYLGPNLLLRTHTSPVQVRVMEREEPPVRIITLGRCYRRDAVDASHFPVFHQCEGLLVERGTNFGHLKGVLNLFLKNIFPFSFQTRFTPAFFPFTEPSAEVSISCPVCRGKGCSSCGRSGFLEILGCGMVHPGVLEKVGYDPEKTAGFAFGLGVERIAMIKYRIPDIRLFWENDLRFLRQFF